MTNSNTNLPADMEKRLQEIMTSSPEGVTQVILQKSIPDLAATELLKLLNSLLKQRKIDLLKKKNQLVYKWITDTGAKKFHSSDVEEKVIYEAVKKAGNNGISAKELKFACNMPQPQITKILKSMESRKLVKSITSITKKKVFMLYELEPSTTVTGGTFYSGEDFEAEYVDVLGEQCYRFLLQSKGIAEKLSDPISQKRASYKSSKEICDYINGLKISKVELKIADIEKVLQSLIYDGKLQKNVTFNKSSGSENYYAACKPLLPNVGLMRMPCGVCLVFQECGRGREVSPATCQYMKEWLEF